MKREYGGKSDNRSKNMSNVRFDISNEKKDRIMYFINRGNKRNGKYVC